MLLVRRGLKVLKQIDMNTITSTFQENSESNLAQCLQNLEEGPYHILRIQLKKGIS